MMTAALFAPAPPRRAPGRPPVSSIPAEREKHIAVARYRLVLGVPQKITAHAFGISPRSVKYYLKRARDYPEAAHLFRQ